MLKKIRFFFIFICAVVSNYSYATIGVGIAGIASSDGRWHPALDADFQINEYLLSRVYYYGIKSTYFNENKFLFNVSYTKDMGLFESKDRLFFALGPTVFFHRTKNIEKGQAQYQGSLGGSFGVHWRVISVSFFGVKLSYEAHVFPAGFNFLVLAYDRLQVASVTLELLL